jgi:steroid delta-isomerase-like uncharacterized protein
MNAADRNRALAERWFEEVWNERRDETIDELIAEGGIANHEGGPPADKEYLKSVRAALLAAISDLRVTEDDTLAYGNDVVVRWRMKGTHDGPGLGFPPSGKAIDARGMTWLRFEDGQIVEGWDSWNQGAFLAALGPSDARPEAEAEAEEPEIDVEVR